MIEIRAFILRQCIATLLLVCIANAMSFAQEKNLAYYNDHESKIIGDAQKAFQDCDYERVLKLCDCHYLIVGDGRANKLKQKAKSCQELYQSMVELNTSGQPSAAREKAQAILAINPDDRNAQIIYSSTRVGSSTGSETGHIWVDLGLSVKWATCNVGATKPEEYGNYFAWGETKPKSDYKWETYKWCNGTANSLTKYNTSSDYGAVGNKTELDRADDAARANWGGSWRMPTDAEWAELETKSTWTWTAENGVNGYRVTSKNNGNSIFLPAAGGRDDTSLYSAGSFGSYWSSSLYTDGPGGAWCVYFYSDNVGRGGSLRYFGQSVRPVTE